MLYMLMQTISEEMATTNIRIELETKDKLSALGKHGDSFNSIIEMLIYEHGILAELAKGHQDKVTRIHNFYHRK